MLDELFDDYEKFVDFFKANDSKELRDRLLKTDKLRYWYCYFIRMRKEVLKAITWKFTGDPMIRNKCLLACINYWKGSSWD